jgi:hypothetical protein
MGLRARGGAPTMRFHALGHLEKSSGLDGWPLPPGREKSSRPSAFTPAAITARAMLAVNS